MQSYKYKKSKINHKRACRSIHAAHVGFKTYFNVGAIKFMDPLLTAVTGRYNLDVINLDNWFHKQGYAEEIHGSMKDYICESYGKDAMDFIISLLIVRPRKISRRTREGRSLVNQL